MNNRPRVIVAEDNPRDREFLAHALGGNFSLSMAADGEEALELLRGQTTPLVLSDLQMPRLNGIDLASRLWRTAPAARIVFWSQHKDEVYLRALARITPPETVYGYVLKDNPAEVLCRAVRVVLIEAQRWIDPSVRQVQTRAQHEDQALTDFEYEVLVDIALGLTDQIIAQRRYLSRRGVQNRLQSLYGKLCAQPETGGPGETLNLRARAIAVALQRGLINPFELEAEERKLRTWLSVR